MDIRCEYDNCGNLASWDVCEGCFLCEYHSQELADAWTDYMESCERGYDQHCEDQASLSSVAEPLERPWWEGLHGR